MRELRGLRILLVDDSHLIRKLMRKLLTKLIPSVIIDEAEDGLPAVKMVKVSMTAPRNMNQISQYSNPDMKLVNESDEINVDTDLAATNSYSIIFIDNIMSQLHGPEAVVQIRALGYEGLIIAVTGNVLKSDVDNFIKCGVDDVLFKPITESILHKVLIAWYGNCRCLHY
jgi:CheY-like chemotaxis protein